MSSSDRSGHDRVEGVGSDDDVKVEQVSALFDHPLPRRRHPPVPR
jgi:hypothetical protein